MKFNVTSPCAHCPFRKDVPGYLRPERVEGLAEQLTKDDQSWFACHETTTSKGRSVRNKKAAQCAGSMILLQKLKLPNVAMRIAFAVGILKMSDLNMKAPVFDTFKQFVAHHTRAYRRKR